MQSKAEDDVEKTIIRWCQALGVVYVLRNVGSTWMFVQSQTQMWNGYAWLITG